MRFPSPRRNLATYLCDQEGNEIRRLTLAASNRDIVRLDEISVYLQNAVVAIEDRRFYEHHGIDTKGILRAFFSGITHGSFSEGAEHDHSAAHQKQRLYTVDTGELLL